MNGLFYMIILTYTPNERDIIQNAPNPLFRVFNENTQKKEYIFSKKVPIFVLRNNVKATT